MTRILAFALMLVTACGAPFEPEPPPAFTGCTYVVTIPLRGGGVMIMTAWMSEDHPYCQSLGKR